MKILSINPGSTSTKIALYEDLNPIFIKTLRHKAEEIAQFKTVFEQFPFRKDLIIKFINENDVEVGDIDAIIGRGGLLKPIHGGIYRVNRMMLEDLKNTGARGEHASNLGAVLAYEIANTANKDIPSFIADPVVVDELEDVARYSGHPLLPKISIFHALNQKAIARKYAREINKQYKELNLIVAHLGGGVSVGLHLKGRVVDVNNALNGGGPLSPERSGTLPTASLVELCFSNKYQKSEILKMLTGDGGVLAFLGTNDMYEVEIRALEKNDTEAKKIIDVFIYQVVKEIGSLSTVNSGQIDAILITGGIAYSKFITNEIAKRVSFIAPVKVYGGEDEMGALTESAYYAMKNEMPISEYK